MPAAALVVNHKRTGHRRSEVIVVSLHDVAAGAIPCAAEVVSASLTPEGVVPDNDTPAAAFLTAY